MLCFTANLHVLRRGAQVVPFLAEVALKMHGPGAPGSTQERLEVQTLLSLSRLVPMHMFIPGWGQIPARK